jgi:hypothetical protein
MDGDAHVGPEARLGNEAFELLQRIVRMAFPL